MVSESVSLLLIKIDTDHPHMHSNEGIHIERYDWTAVLHCRL